MNSKEVESAAIESGGVDVIVVDSVAALVPNAEIQNDMGEPHAGLQTRLMPQLLRKLASPVARSSH
jgi:recombination protein RecA